MVQQCCELQLLFLACCFAHTLQPAWPALPTRGSARVRLLRVLLGQRPSLHNLLRPSLAFVRLLRWYYATVRLPTAVHLGLIAHRLLPAVRVVPTTDSSGVSRFSRVEFLCMPGVFDSAGDSALAFTYTALLSSGWADTVDSLIGPISELTTSGYPACICPFPTLQVRPCGPPSHGRGQDGRYSFPV